MARSLKPAICEVCAVTFHHRQKVAPPTCSRRCGGLRSVQTKLEQGTGHRAPDCVVPNCPAKAHTKGLCITHWRRQERSGTTDSPQGRKPDGLSVYDWFMSKVEKTDTCWIWRGQVANQRFGYGLFYDADKGKKIRAHHFLVPPIPSREESEGVKMNYDHLCQNVLCVNPDHLELVPAAENARRAAEFRWIGKQSSAAGGA